MQDRRRDLKPANILLDGKYEMRIGDLGSSRRINLQQTVGVGTVYYLAPESLPDGTNCICDERVDVFSFAVILWEIVSGQKAYTGYHNLKLVSFMTKVRDGLRPEMVPMKRWTSELITRSWEKEPKLRPSFGQVFKTLRKENYAIWDDVDKEEVSRYVTMILRFER